MHIVIIKSIVMVTNLSFKCRILFIYTTAIHIISKKLIMIKCFWKDYKIGVNDKTAVPIGKSGLSVRSDVKSMSSGFPRLVEVERNNLVIDQNFYKANIRPSLALIIKTPKNNISLRNGIVTIF